MLGAVVVCQQALSGSVVGPPDTTGQPLKPLTLIHATELLSACNQKKKELRLQGGFMLVEMQ